MKPYKRVERRRSGVVLEQKDPERERELRVNQRERD